MATQATPPPAASIERIPKTSEVLLVWNNHQNVDDAPRGKRTRYNVAVSRDEGKTWKHTKTLEDDPDGWYCYTAVELLDDHVLLGHCAGNRKTTGGLAITQITRFSLDWLYK
ncbi:MAG: sialidase family protein [Planctomycetota bacterium]